MKIDRKILFIPAFAVSAAASPFAPPVQTNLNGSECSALTVQSVTSAPKTYADWAADAETAADLAPGTLTDSPLADFNGDGLPNLVAYTLGLSPTEPSAHLAPALAATADGHQMVYWNDTSITDATLTIEVSSNLQTWHTPGEPGFPPGLGDTAGDLEKGIQFRTLSIPAATPAMFVRLRAAILDSDAAAYAELTGLSGAQLNRLSGFLHDLKDADIDLKLVTLGRGEFLARDGSTHRAVIGPDGNIAGTLANDEVGIGFDGSTANIFEFDNPAPTTDGNVWQMVVVIPDAIARYTLISGAGSGTPEHGPEVRYRESGRVEYRVGVPPNGARVTRQSSIATGGAGVPMLYGGQLRGPSNIDAIKDIYPENIGGIGNGKIWNNQPVWRLGSNLSDHNRLKGKISLALAGEGVLNRQQIYQMGAAIVRHGVGGINPPRWIGFVGDSMTVSTAGGAGPGEDRSSLWTTLESGWKGSFWDMRAQGGRPWVGNSPNQEEMFQEMLGRMSWVPDMPRTIVFWAGFNTPPSTWETKEGRETLANHYLDAAAQCAAAGIQTLHWSRPVDGNTSSPGGSYWDNIQAFNDYYRDQLAQLPGDHIYYDHRLTFSNGEFDGASRNEAYYGDLVHLSALGVQVMTEDFLARFPNP